MLLQSMLRKTLQMCDCEEQMMDTHLFISQALLIHYFLQLLLPENSSLPLLLLYSHQLLCTYAVVLMLKRWQKQ